MFYSCCGDRHMSIFRQIALESGAPAARVVPEEMRRCKRLAKLAAPWQIRNRCIDVLEVPSGNLT